MRVGGSGDTVVKTPTKATLAGTAKSGRREENSRWWMRDVAGCEFLAGGLNSVTVFRIFFLTLLYTLHLTLNILIYKFTSTCHGLDFA